MKRTRRTRKNGVKNADVNTKKEELRSVRKSVIRWNGRERTTMGAGNSQVNDLTGDLSQEDIYLKNNQSVKASGSKEEGNHLDPTNTCPVCFSALKPACIKGTADKLLQCTRCPTAQLLCGSCLYPCTSAACTNKLCPLVSTLLTCEVVSDPQSKVLGCPTFRACPKCHNLIMHEKGCKFVACASCRHCFCFICLQDDCRKNTENYWKLTCTKPRAERQRFMSPQS